MNSFDITVFEGDSISDIKNKLQEQFDDTEKILSLFDPAYYIYRSGEPKTFRYVGSFTVYTDDFSVNIYSFPKYMKGQKVKPSDIEPIIRAIEFSHLFFIHETSVFDETKKFAETSKIQRTRLAEWLINDYFTNGIIDIKVKRSDFRQRGRTNWSKTTAKLIPVTDGTEFVYPKTIHNYYSRDDSMLISDIHRAALTESAEVMRGMGRENIPYFESNPAMLGKLGNYVSVIRKMQSRVYEDGQINLLRALEAWCLEYSRFYRQPLGTVSFELVWERCLRAVFDNVSSTIEGDFTFGEPVYHIFKNDYSLTNSNGIPDIINVNSEQKEFMLLDAKYYIGEIKNGKISGMPMYKDISKQLYYYQMMESYGLKTGVNAFVMPWHDLGISMEESDDYNIWFRYIGYVDYPSKKDRICEMMRIEKSAESGKVLLVQIKPEKLFQFIFDTEDKKNEHLNELWGVLEGKTDETTSKGN